MRIAVTALGAALALLAVGACGSSSGWRRPLPRRRWWWGEFNPVSADRMPHSGRKWPVAAFPAVRLINSSGGVLGHKLKLRAGGHPRRPSRRRAGRAEDDGDGDVH